jgi:gonadotropin-releasing hormone receptor
MSAVESGVNGTPVPMEYEDLPIDMRFNDGHVVSIVTYSVLMIVSAIGNITVLALLLRRRGNAARTRINTMLIHLAIADLLVSTRP